MPIDATKIFLYGDDVNISDLSALRPVVPLFFVKSEGTWANCSGVMNDDPDELLKHEGAGVESADSSADDDVPHKTEMFVFFREQTVHGCRPTTES